MFLLIFREEKEGGEGEMKGEERGRDREAGIETE